MVVVNFFFFFQVATLFFIFDCFILFFFCVVPEPTVGFFFLFFFFFYGRGDHQKDDAVKRRSSFVFFSEYKKNNVHPQSVNVSQQPRNETKRPVKVNQNNYNKITIRINLIMARNNPQSIKLMLHKRKVSIPQLVNRATKIRYQKNALSIQFPSNEMEKLGTNSVNSVPSQEMPSQ